MRICAREGAKLTVTIDDSKIYTKPFEWLEASYHWEVKQDFDEAFCAPSERREYIKTLAPHAGPGTSSKCRDSSQANCTTHFTRICRRENTMSVLKL